ncbi:MAG: hypothetical protein JETCAE03_31950 [Ignavibacteriaceae bacterium]|jgi:hypothetical protein|nr:MAG: hypothetical protein JETCAE03_31950 [Ignavibacteriaceae bacterium]
MERKQIEKALKNTRSVGEASAYLNVNRRTFKRWALKYDLYHPKKHELITYKLEDIFAGKHPQYPTSKLSKRLVKEGYKEYKCETCSIDEWMGKPISLELNHKDGNRYNHLPENLELLCPNCHSQTPTYRSKNLKHKKHGK